MCSLKQKEQRRSDTTRLPEGAEKQGRQIGLIDFDEFCMAEPALDIAVFLAAIKDVGLTSDDTLQSAPQRQERLTLLESIGEAFLEEYEQRAPLSRPGGPCGRRSNISTTCWTARSRSNLQK